MAKRVMSERSFVRGRMCPGCMLHSVPTLEEWGGMCADCWRQLDDNERAAITGDATEARRVVTYTLPARPGLFSRFIVGALSAFGGAFGALGLWHWLGW